MRLSTQRHELQLANVWKISRGATSRFTTVIVRLVDEDGVVGLGEGAPISRYGESADSVERFCSQLDPTRLRFDNLTDSQAYLESLGPGNYAAKCAVDIALHDGAAQLVQHQVSDFLGLGFTESNHQTSFTIGIDEPEMIREKVLDALEYPVLKLKLGTANDRQIFRTARDAAPSKPVRIDANEGWTSKEAALTMIEWLAQQGGVQFIEQPMPAQTSPHDWKWLKDRSPLPIFADESYHSAADAEHCAANFNGVNVKLVKTGGITGAFAALRAARKHGLQTMIGCMIETSVLITAAAHLAELSDYLDLDGNILVTNDPFTGVQTHAGMLSFSGVKRPFGLRVQAHKPDSLAN